MICNVNIWAVLVSSIVATLIGSFWYSKYAFGKTWMALSNISMDATVSGAKMARLYGLQFIGTLVMTFVLARAIFFIGSSTWLEGAFVGFWIWLGFIATVAFGASLWDKKPCKLIAINQGYYLVILAVSGIILAVWR